MGEIIPARHIKPYKIIYKCILSFNTKQEKIKAFSSILSAFKGEFKC